MLFLGAGNIEGRKETKGKERKIICLNFFLFVVSGLSTQLSRFVVGELWVCCVHERI